MHNPHVIAEAEDIAARADATDHMTVCWTPVGGVAFYPESSDLERLARRLIETVEFLSKHPALIGHAAGVCK